MHIRTHTALVLNPARNYCQAALPSFARLGCASMDDNAGKSIDITCAPAKNNLYLIFWGWDFVNRMFNASDKQGFLPYLRSKQSTLLLKWHEISI
jgi:hypothetical protein